MDPNNNLDFQNHLDTSNHNRFYPKTLKLSKSFPSSRSLSVHRWKENLTNPIQTLDEHPLVQPTHHHPTRSQQIPSKPTSQRLRTRSLDRKPSLIGTSDSINRKNSLSGEHHHTHSSSSSLSSHPNIQHHPHTRFHSHLPIERTVLSVLPTNRRKHSIDSTGTGSLPQIPPPNGSWQSSSPSITCSGSPNSTLATSVDSTGTPARPRYQPRPLLLSAFGTKNNRRTTHLEPFSHPARSPKQPNSRLITPSEQNNRLDKAQQVHQERLHAREAKKLRKRAREAELVALSNPTLQGRQPIEQEDDCWSWVSCSDAEFEEVESDEEPEEMAVVWRASLDVGRRVNKDRRALGRGHAIHLPSNRPRPSPSTPLVHHRPRTGFQFLSPLRLLQHALLKRNLLINYLRATPIGPLLFGSGLLSGLICSLLCSSFTARLPSPISSRLLLPLSSSGIGLFFNLVFPSSNSLLSSPALSFLHPGTIGTSFGLCAQWS